MATTTEPLWDVTIGSLGFLLANNGNRPYLRESTPARRDRFDQGREPGENSLDSALWIRSQTSWHLGAGQEFAEPLETAPEVARFQFNQSYGVDPFTPGKATVLKLPDTLANSGLCERLLSMGADSYGYNLCLGYWGATANVAFRGIRRLSITNAGARANARMCSLTDIYPETLTTDGVNWWAYSAASGTLRGTGATDTYVAIAGGGGGMHYGLGRLWIEGVGGVYEITNPTTFTALPAAVAITAPNGTESLTSNSRALYFLDNLRTSVYRVTINSDASLSAPKQVAQTPRGESINKIYCYGDWLVMLTTLGVRICDASNVDEILVGPVCIDMPYVYEQSPGYGFTDVDGVGDSLYLAAGRGVSSTYRATPATVGDMSGLFRIDLSQQLSSINGSLAGRYAWAQDVAITPLYASEPVTRWVAACSPTSIWFSGGVLATGGAVYQTYSGLTNRMSGAWLASGQVDFSTSEKKAWLGVNVDAGIGGTVRIYGTGPSGTEYEITSGAVNAPVNAQYTANAANLVPGGWLRQRVALTGTVELYSTGLYATPVPKRTRYVRYPVFCFDQQTDRNNIDVGYVGYGYTRLKALEALEESGALVTVVDNRTGETLRCMVDRVSFEGNSPPSRGATNEGGVATVTLLVV